MCNLSNKVAVVTGAASGIGAAIAQRLTDARLIPHDPVGLKLDTDASHVELLLPNNATPFNGRAGESEPLACNT